MINPSRVLIENTLKSSFNLVIYFVNRYGEEHDKIFKKTKKKFFSELDLDTCRVKIVDDYPPREMEMDLFYVKRTGKTVWIRIREGGDELWASK